VLSLILPHINHGNILFVGADAVTQNRDGVILKACLRYIHMRGWFDHVSHLESTVMGTRLMVSARIQLLSLFYNVLHVRHPCYMFSLFHFAASARTRNLVISPHRTLAVGQSFDLLACKIFLHNM
jgi:hypothetical protein